MQNHRGRVFRKSDVYIPVYERYLQKFCGKPVNILEIGVNTGGSLQIWKKYFGQKARVFGVDIDPNCKNFEESQIEIFIGDQENKGFLKQLSQKLPKLDIIIDDGGHTMIQQINSFEILYPGLAHGGVYICEDCNTSYMPNYGGGFRQSGTFIEHMKDKIDLMNMAFGAILTDNEFGETTPGIHFHKGMVVLEKEELTKPVGLIGGGKEGLRPNPHRIN